MRGQGTDQERVALLGIGGTRRGAFRVADVGAVDELGYLALPAEAAATIFQIVSQRCLKTSTVLTGNRRVGAHQVGNFDEHLRGIPLNCINYPWVERPVAFHCALDCFLTACVTRPTGAPTRRR